MSDDVWRLEEQGIGTDRFTRYVLRTISGEARGLGAGALRGLLHVLSWGYLAGLHTLGLAQRVGLLPCDGAPCAVISIGNLTVGGTGKSTVTATLAQWLKEAGYHPAVLSRGYRATGNAPVRIVADGKEVRLSPEQGGDEPVMLARHLDGVPVLVGRDRVLTARAAAEQFGADVCLLDDGFQVRNLKKDLEIVLLESSRAFDNGYLLPRGLLREPPHCLRRADVVVLMDPHRATEDLRLRLRERVRTLAPHALVVEACRTPKRLREARTDADVPFDRLKGTPVVALSGIGNPQSFEALLVALGAKPHPLRLPDHHHYTPADIARVEALARSVDATAIVTTEKDAVKLEGFSFSLPCWVLTICLRFLAGEEALRQRVMAVAQGGKE